MTVALEHQARACLTPGRGRKACAHADKTVVLLGSSPPEHAVNSLMTSHMTLEEL